MINGDSYLHSVSMGPSVDNKPNDGKYDDKRQGYAYIL